MTTEQILWFLVIVHYLADFCLQTHEQAVKKSTSVRFLLYHVMTYTFVWAAMSPFIFDWNIQRVVAFTVITGFTHFWVDYVTSRMGKPFWAKGDFHNGFAVVGFDQILHYLQLYYTVKLCFLL